MVPCFPHGGGPRTPFAITKIVMDRHPKVVSPIHKRLKEARKKIAKKSLLWKRLKTISERWVDGSGKWGPATKRLRDGLKRARGRELWKLKDEHCDFIDIGSFKLYENHVKSNPIHTYGYARKSPSKESNKKRVDLLQEMVDRLKRQGYCTKVFVSPVSKADQSILARDMGVDTDAFTKELTDCKGNTQKLLAKPACDFQKVRIVCLGYADLYNLFHICEAAPLRNKISTKLIAINLHFLLSARFPYTLYVIGYQGRESSKDLLETTFGDNFW
ncbi:hypothetical protein CLU79DRAFT_876446 [Phycomyces nitens]|nr:hypothetical protein CLU79DRAFT_876446 [Phycomyces nitens]